MKCIKCESDITPTAKFCLQCGAAQATKQFEAATTPVPSPKIKAITNSPFFPRLRVRYQDAYAVARGLVKTGRIIEDAGLVIGGILLLVGLIFFFRDEGMTGALEGILLILIGAMTAGGCFIAGILTAAVGQFMSAAIDTAVNTSENISPDEKSEILGLAHNADSHISLASHLKRLFLKNMISPLRSS